MTAGSLRRRHLLALSALQKPLLKYNFNFHSTSIMVALTKSTTQFLAWTASKGIETPLDLNERSDGSRYTTAKVDLDNTSDILQIPISACITSDSLDGLAERLAYERKLESKSEFAPYMDVLPTLEGGDNPYLATLPRFWESKRLERVADSGQLERRMMNDARKDLDQWALACVDSRANFLGDGRYAMTPWLDMINHDASIQTRARIEEDKGFAGLGDILQLQSGKNYAKGSEVFISYGNLSNLDTLVDYGFVSDTNPCNTETIAVRMMGQQPFTLTVYPDGSVDAGSKATLRYNLATPEELEIFSTIEKGTGLGILAKPLSDRNELDVQSFIASTIDEALYETKAGAAETKDDALINMYLSARQKQFELAIERITHKFPGIEY